MRKLSLCLAVASFASFQSFAQNHWPSTGNAGIGTGATPDYPFHIKHDAPTIKLESTNATSKVSAIRGNGNVWMVGWVGEPGSEELRLGTFEAGSRTISLSAGGAERMKFLANGYIGIGTTSPSAQLHVKADRQEIRIGTGTNTSSYTLSIGVNDDGVNFSNDSYGRGYRFRNANGLLMDISRDGNVGIGAPAQTAYKFAVNGDAIFTKVKVKTYTSWPDFVFEEKYELPSLQTVEKFIKTNKHLPGVPSAAEVSSSGIDLADMNAKLLQKVEELTLYLIEQNKKLEQQQQEIDQLKQR